MSYRTLHKQGEEQMLKRLGLDWSSFFPKVSFAMVAGPATFGLLKGIIITITTIASIPVIVIVMLFAYVPEIGFVDYVPSQELLELELSEAVRDLLAGELKIDITEERINQFIHSYIVEEINPSYNPASNCRDNDCRFVFVETNGAAFGVNAIWATLLNDELVLNIAVTDLVFTGEQTAVVRMRFELTDNAEVFEVKFAGFQTGYIPLPLRFIVNLITPILESNGVALTSTGTNGVTYDIANLSFLVDKQTLIDEMIDNEMLVYYASLIVQEELLQVTIDPIDKQIRLFVDQERLYTQTSIPLVPGSVELVTVMYLRDLIAAGTVNIGDLFR
jgi:lipoprotein signal peptidase